MGVAPMIDDVQPVENETRDRIMTGAVTAIPFVALIVVGWQLWNEALHWSDVIVFGICYVLTGFGVTIGFHRLLTHRSFATHRGIAYLLAVLGSMSVQGPVIGWVADHRTWFSKLIREASKTRADARIAQAASRAGSFASK